MYICIYRERQGEKNDNIKYTSISISLFMYLSLSIYILYI